MTARRERWRACSPTTSRRTRTVSRRRSATRARALTEAAPATGNVVDVLVIAGPAGVGKSTTAYELSDQLRETSIDHAVVDTDELDRLYPVPDDIARLTERTLTAVWQAFRDRGARRLILVGVFADKPSELDWIARAIPGARYTLVRLVATNDTLAERIRRREIGSRADAQLGRTSRQVAAMQGDERAAVVIIDTTGRSVVDVVAHIRRLWPRGEGTGPSGGEGVA